MFLPEFEHWSVLLEKERNKMSTVSLSNPKSSLTNDCSFCSALKFHSLVLFSTFIFNKFTHSFNMCVTANFPVYSYNTMIPPSIRSFFSLSSAILCKSNSLLRIQQFSADIFVCIFSILYIQSVYSDYTHYRYSHPFYRIAPEGPFGAPCPHGAFCINSNSINCCSLNNNITFS